MDSDLLALLLQKLTVENERVCLPGMGSFIMEDIPSVLLDGGKRITPPGRRILFKSSLTLNDGRLETAYARAQGVTLPQAREMLLAAVKELIGQMEEQGQVQLSGFGTFRSGEGGRYFFVADKDFNVAPDSFGLETLALKIKGEAPGEAGNESGKEASAGGNISGKKEETEAEDIPPDGIRPDALETAAPGEIAFPADTVDTVETVEIAEIAETESGAVKPENGHAVQGEIVKNPAAAQDSSVGMSEEPSGRKEPAGANLSGTGENRKEDGKREGLKETFREAAGPGKKGGEAAKEVVPGGAGETVGIQKEEKIQKAGEAGKEKRSAVVQVLRIALCILGISVIVLLLVYIFRDSLHPLLEKIFYSKEELEILRQSGRM